MHYTRPEYSAVRQPGRNLAIIAFVAVSVMFAASGCSTRFGVDGIRNTRVAEQKVSYVIRSANPQVSQTGAEFQREAAFVKTALSSKGFYEAPPGTPVDMVVEVDCGMEAPKTTTRNYRDTKHEVVTTTRETPVVENRDGTYSGGITETTTRIVETAAPDRTATFTTYPKFLRITARESPETAGDHAPREVWSVYVTNEDKNDDLDAYVPLLVAAAMDKVNEDTKGEVRVVLKPQDERVKFVEKGM